MIEPGSYVLTGNRAGMIGSRPMIGDQIEVHFFTGTRSHDPIKTERVNWRQLTVVTGSTWDKARQRKT